MRKAPAPTHSLEALAKLQACFHAKAQSLPETHRKPLTEPPPPSSCQRSAPPPSAFKPLGRFVAFAYAGCDPEEMGIGPIHAIPKVTQNWQA